MELYSIFVTTTDSSGRFIRYALNTSYNSVGLYFKHKERIFLPDFYSAVNTIDELKNDPYVEKIILRKCKQNFSGEFELDVNKFIGSAVEEAMIKGVLFHHNHNCRKINQVLLRFFGDKWNSVFDSELLLYERNTTEGFPFDGLKILLPFAMSEITFALLSIPPSPVDSIRQMGRQLRNGSLILDFNSLMRKFGIDTINGGDDVFMSLRNKLSFDFISKRGEIIKISKSCKFDQFDTEMMRDLMIRLDEMDANDTELDDIRFKVSTFYSQKVTRISLFD
ncbi:MAG: hypothetical protein AAB966_00895 [Patescibacteria group bacterium]